MTGERVGYRIARDGALEWVPPGWPFSPPVRLTLPRPSDAERLTRQREHAARIANDRFGPTDWPPYLVGFVRRRPPTWRVIEIDPKTGKRGKVFDYPTRLLAIAHGEEYALACGLKGPIA